MATRSNWRDDSTSFDIDVDGDLDLDATTPVRSFDVRAAFDLDQTMANPDHPLITAEREIWNRERARISSPPPPPVLAPMPSIYAMTPPRQVAPQVAPQRHVAPPAPPSYPESHGSLAPTAMELPQSYFPSYATPANGVKAPPLSIVASTASLSHHAPTPMMLEAMPAKRLMSPAKIAAMCGVLAVAAAVAAFAAASGADSGMDPNAPPFVHANANPNGVNEGVHNASAPRPENTVIPYAGPVQAGPVQANPAAQALPADVAQLFVPPTDPNSDWRARLVQGQSTAAIAKAQR